MSDFRKAIFLAASSHGLGNQRLLHIYLIRLFYLLHDISHKTIIYLPDILILWYDSIIRTEDPEGLCMVL